MTDAVTYKSILVRSKLPRSEYCVNSYIGCTHGCRYCYAKSLRRFKRESRAWGSYVNYKQDADKVLEAQLARSPKAGRVLLSSITDPYQPIEERLQLTRRCLAVLIRYGLPLSVLTKSDLVLRDKDLLQAYSEVEVGVSISTLNSSLGTFLEPGAPSTTKRLDALLELSSSGIRTYGFISPVLPQVTEIEEIVSRLAGRVSYIMGEALNLRCGNRTDLNNALRSAASECHFAHWIKMSKDLSYHREISQRLKNACVKQGIPFAGYYSH